MRVLLEDMKQRIIATTKDDNVEDVDITNSRSIGGDDNMKIDDEIDDDNDDDDDAEFTSRITEAYIDELSHRYLSYTHGTVVEFTEDENHVGLPVSIAKALLQPNKHSLANRGRRMRTMPSDDGTQSLSMEEDIIIPSTRTVDPASLMVTDDRNGNIGKSDYDNDDSMNFVESSIMGTTSNDMTERTPGHPAYNQFDIPSFPIEIIPLTLLPPGKDITFTPTSTSIQNGFYNLKDIKMVLEQSLVRSRATLSLGDVVKTWKRGVEYDLIVSDLNPRGYGVVSCVDTDLNVEFGSPDEMIDNHLKEDEVGAASKMAEDKYDDVGAIPTPMNSTPKLDNSTVVATKLRELIPEPPMDVKLGVCNSQIRGRTLSGTDATGRRRFDVASATLADLFDFASNVCGGIEPTTFRLVTRFPRRVFTLNVGDDKATLESVGISPGQEMFMVESI
jgi:Fe-S cluster assembly iron-binding protein IscA